METRALTDAEIATLTRQNCSAASWDAVRVHPRFSPNGVVTGTAFSGDIVLGLCVGQTGEPSLPPPGIHQARLHNVTVGDGCRIAQADIADADIGDNAVVYKVDSISHAGASSFGNGSPCQAVAEDGARSIPLWRNLSAQWAHLILHVKNSAAARRLEQLIHDDAQALRSTRSHIGTGCRIQFAGTLRNVHLGPGTILDSTAKLVDCTTVSSEAAPAFLGEGVSAEDCIFLQGSRTAGGARLVHSLVGEGVTLDHAFFAKHSLFFANSEFTLGESACSVCGPFAVSHHRATLILTCQCSFNTFGSAANSSNHHFKLGPRHGGVLRRGTRCGSGSYLFWPCDIGAFSSVVGKHMRHLDTAAFPFSLLTAVGDESVLVPGVNLFSAGVFRDERKWPQRDKRSAIASPRDLVNPAVMSPYAMQAILRGLELLRAHRIQAGEGKDLSHGGAIIPASRVEPGITFYENALLLYLGDCLARNLGELPTNHNTAIAAVTSLLHQQTTAPSNIATHDWRDWGGMLLSGAAARTIVSGIEDGDLTTADAVDAALRSAHAAYVRDELDWTISCWREHYGEASAETVSNFLDACRDAVAFRTARQLKDAAKEFQDSVMLGFGVEDDARQSFQRVRGDMDDDPVVTEMRSGTDAIARLTRLARQ